MKPPKHPPLHRLDEDAALRAILEGTVSETGAPFFAALVQRLAAALDTHGAWVTEYLPDKRRLRALAFWLDGKWIDHYEIDIAGTPCEQVIETAQLVHYPERLIELFAQVEEIREAGFVSYLGVPLTDVNGRVLGHMAVVDRRPMPGQPRALALFQIFGTRAAAELRRLRAETLLREREEQLSRIVGSAFDAIVEFDHTGRIRLMNPAAETVLGCPSGVAAGKDVRQFFSVASRRTLDDLLGRLNDGSLTERALWIPGGLEAHPDQGEPFPAEASLARFAADGQPFFTLILRNVNDRLEAEARLAALRSQAEYLQEEVRALHNFDGIIGHSPALRNVLRDVEQVAVADTTVLILGETGTGKELIARAVHSASPRRERPLITVNCAAIPAALIESEFFGHEKGAFTGATSKRDGRFALADGGTIFLDEVGELPLDLQGKLLRVLQEGTFEPVGSATTRKVDVRIIAATNRELLAEVKAGRFREDLFYRLNVFPLPLPPLRERLEDIPLIAEAFARRFARRLGRTLAPLTPACTRRLQSYAWPGNVRELENVIERAVITATGACLNLDRALPEVAVPVPPPNIGNEPPPIRTAKELEALERDNLVRALETCGWRISGASGAAQMLGLNPSTLTSRMKALGIQRDR